MTSVDTGAQLFEQKNRFDSHIQIIEGIAEIVINNQPQRLEPGGGIIVTAHSTYRFINKEKFKMIVTIIKSGYED